MRSMNSRADRREPEAKTITTCSPGGAIAQHYRVQYRAATESFWHLFAACRQREQAQRCLEQLTRQGYRVRMVSYRLCPVSA